jgi:hypothetical protein
MLEWKTDGVLYGESFLHEPTFRFRKLDVRFHTQKATDYLYETIVYLKHFRKQYISLVKYGRTLCVLFNSHIFSNLVTFN